MRPATRYARTRDGIRIAYSVVGNGSPLVRVTQVRWNHADAWWDIAPYRAMAQRLGEQHAFVAYDARGTGLSQPGDYDYGLESQLCDLEAVLDDLGVQDAALIGWQMGSPVAIACAPRRPERVSSLVLVNPHASGKAFLRVPLIQAREGYRTGGEAVWEEYRRIIAVAAVPPGDPALQDAVVAVMGMANTPETVRRHADQHAEIDVSALLPQVAAPTLVVISSNSPWRHLSHDVAREIAYARTVMCEGGTQLWLPDDVSGEVLDFLAEQEAEPTDQRAPGPVDNPLSRREMEVLRRIAEGRSNGAIAEELGISINTVMHHVSSILQKVGASSRAEAVSRAYLRGMLS